MEKQIVQGSYWLGLVSFVIALVLRGCSALGLGPAEVLKGVSYMTFYKGALILFVLAIATASLAASKSEKA
jgi:hypothetical protein